MRRVREFAAGGGRSFSAPRPRRGVPHAWQTTAEWNGTRWEARVRAGFVNGLDPVCRGYLPGEGGEVREVDLIDGPVIPLNVFRTPGEDDPLPVFFERMGVRKPDGGGVQVMPGGVVVDTTEPAGAAAVRLLRAVDFYVAVARPSYQATARVVDATGVSGKVVDWAVGYDTSNVDRVGARARLMQAAKFPAVRRPTLIERLLGLFQDEGEDRIWISTVFLLSPPGAMGGPDGSWMAFAQHNPRGGFYDLMHASANEVPRQVVEPIRLFTGLAGGIGDLIGNQLLAPFNDFAQRVEAAVATTTTEGRFWNI